LYALRYQKLPGNQIGNIVELLTREGVEDAEVRSSTTLFTRNLLFCMYGEEKKLMSKVSSRVQMVNIMLGFAGAEQRQDDLFSNENFFSRGKSALKGLKVTFETLSLYHDFLRD